MKLKYFIFLLCISSLLGNASEETKTRKIRFWHSMSGSLQEKLAKVVDKFNQSQNEVFIESIYKGNYTDALNGMVAAYRGGKQPHIAQIFEVATQSMMKSESIVPVEELMTEEGYPLNKADFLEAVAGYYSSKEGKLLSMPFNSSTPILFYNQDILDAAGIKKIPETWDELHQTSKEIKEKTGLCGMVFGWQSLTLVESFLAINDVPIAIPENGFAGLDVKMNLSNPELIENIRKVADGVKNKYHLFEGRRSDAPRRSFLVKKCAFLVDSSSSIGTLKKTAKFKWGTAMMPYLSGKKPQNSLIGGASLWAIKGHAKEDYHAIAQFFNFLTQPKVQAMWHQDTGYLPVTYSSYKLSTEEGFYAKDPAQETAVKQLLRGPVTVTSKGIRLGNFSQIREVIEENLEQIWAGTVTTEEGLREADERSNLVLKRFAQLRSKNDEGAKSK